jgi:hypothetical protein
MQTEEELAQVNQELSAACREMFPELDCEPGAEVPTGPARRVTILATVGFSADDVRGALVVLASPGFFRATYPLPDPGDIDIRDWAGEVANQILGRINNRFARLGCLFSVGTPAIVSGDDLSVELAADRPHASLRGRLGEHEVFMIFDVQRTDGSALFRPCEMAETMPEGDGILF